MGDTVTAPATVGSDLLYGAAKIAEYLGVKRSVVYHLVETGKLPSFKVGAVVCARRSKLDAAIEQLENECAAA
jgi:excisionase family DNA binding protein